jgi:hypothetical protein
MEPKKKSYKTFYIVTGVIVLLYLLSLVPDEKTETTSSPSRSPVAMSAEEMAADSVQINNNLLSKLKASTEEINTIDWDRYTEDLSGPSKGVNRIKEWQRIYRMAKNRDAPANVAATKVYKRLLSKTQIRAFPKLRKAYGKHLADRMWRKDIVVRVSGKRSDLIKFTGGLYAANANKEDNQNSFSPSMRMLRFHQSQYRWYKNQSEYTYYTMIDRGKDGEVEL